jgi:hypothetical protein
MVNIVRSHREALDHEKKEGYRNWFRKVREIGLTKARELGLDPLDKTGVHWY